MTEDEIIKEVRDLRERVGDLEDERDAIKRLPTAVAELKGTVQALQSILLARFDGVENKVDSATGLKTAIQFAAVVIVPILIALIGGYVAIRAGVTANGK